MSMLLLATMLMTSTPMPADTARLRRELEAVNAAELAAVLRGDAAGAAAYYDAHAWLLPPDGSHVRGRAAIETYWRGAAGTEFTDAETTTLDVGGDDRTAWLAGTYRLAGRPRGSTDAPATTRGTFLLVFRRTPTGWRIVQDAWSAAPAVSASP